MSRTVVMNNRFIPSDFLPIGFLGYLPYAAIPDGWRVCDGTVYNIVDYPELAAKLGTTYGGDGVTTFAVPDDRGLFRRGLDLGKGYDSGRVLGSYQDQDVQPHAHPISGYGAQIPSSGLGGNGGSWVSGPLTITATNNSGIETRPQNRAYVPIIKAKNIYYDMTIQGGNAASLGGNPVSYYAANSQAVKYTDFIGTFAANGYRRLPDGTILQWGAGLKTTATLNISFPIVFPSAVYGVFTTVGYSSSMFEGLVGQPSVSGFSLSSGNYGTGYTVYYFAIGR